MLEIGGTVAFISGPELVNKFSDGKLAASVAAEVESLGALFATDTGKISEGSAAEGAGDKIEGAGDKVEGTEDKAEGAGGKAEDARGKEADVTLGALVFTGSKDDGNSGKLEDTAGKEGLKLEYCIGGRSKDCCCKFGSPFGAP